jgi:hypothetical protein
MISTEISSNSTATLRRVVSSRSRCRNCQPVLNRGSDSSCQQFVDVPAISSACDCSSLTVVVRARVRPATGCRPGQQQVVMTTPT